MAVSGIGIRLMAVYGYGCGLNRSPPSLLTFRIQCSSDSDPNRGFGLRPPKRDNKVLFIVLLVDVIFSLEEKVKP